MISVCISVCHSIINHDNAMFVFLSEKPNLAHGAPHMISYTARRKKMFVLLGRGKPPLGPSVTVSCWSAVQDGLHTPAQRHTHPSCCGSRENQHAQCDVSISLPRVVCVNPTLSTPLFSHFVTALQVVLEGSTCCHNMEK